MPDVLIACKAPNGVVLNLNHFVKLDDKGAVRIEAGKQTVTLKGWAHESNRPDPTEGVGGYTLTPVPAEFWEEWLATHPDFPMLADGTILGPTKDGVGQARAHSTVPQMHARGDGELRRHAYKAAD